MVDNADGQFYTMEGMAAAVLMVFTAYIVMSTTTVYTPGDTHIIDMQLEQIGNDALKIMDMKKTLSDEKSDLEYYIKNMSNSTNQSAFAQNFTRLVNNRSYGEPDKVLPDRINFTADVYYFNKTTGRIDQEHFTTSSVKFSGNENSVRVSRWVFLETPLQPPFNNRNQTVLLEVLLWRG